MSIHQKALQAPTGQTTIIGTDLMRRAIEGSRSNPRKRVILPLHKTPEASLHRMLNAIQPSSYIRPHRHLHPPKPETLLVLQGSILCLVFDLHGNVQESIILTAGSSEFGFDCEPGVYHTFVALCPDTVVFEAKPGPYEPATDKDFAPWAPAEDNDVAQNYLASLYLLEKNANAATKQRLAGKLDA